MAFVNFEQVRCQKKNVFLESLPSLTLCSASSQTFCLTARAYLNTQKYGLFYSLVKSQPFHIPRAWKRYPSPEEPLRLGP